MILSRQLQLQIPNMLGNAMYHGTTRLEASKQQKGWGGRSLPYMKDDLEWDDAKLTMIVAQVSDFILGSR